MTEPFIPDVTLERFRLNELPADEAAHIEALIDREPEMRVRLAALARSDDEIRHSGVLHSRPPAAVPQHARPRLRWLIAASAALTTALLAVFVVPRSHERIEGRSEDRIKGLRPALAVYRQTPSGSESLADGAIAHAGDLLRVGYRAAGHSYGVIFSVDGRGTVTMHLPPTGGHAAPLGHEATVLLDTSYELDDAPLWERFYFITGDAPFEGATVVDAVRRASALPKGLEQSTFSLQKEARP
jgi:anti-sigma factor RsiW